MAGEGSWTGVSPESRPARIVSDEQFLAGHSAVLQIRPPLGSHSVSRIATDPTLLGSAVAIGHAAAAIALKTTVSAVEGPVTSPG